MAKNTVFSKKYSLNIHGNIVSLEQPQVMGIINATPDSFYTGSRAITEGQILKKAENMIVEGATFLDIGGYSSRPGATDISVEEEIKRTAPAIEIIKKTFPSTYLSIDTFRAQVASAALESGVDIINDIAGGELDENMFDLVADKKVPYIMMHMRGNPQNMVTKSEYSDLLAEILDYFQKKVDVLRKKGVSDIILDPGFGFAKNIAQNFDLLRDLAYFKVLELPLMMGISRKSLIYRPLGLNADEALNGTSVLNTIGLINGANILRVHDVKEAIEVVKLVDLTYN